MPDGSDSGEGRAEDLIDALRPLLRALGAERSLSAGKIGILRNLDRRAQATTSDLASLLSVSPQAASLAVRELEELGLVARQADAGDRRRSWISLTDGGRERLAQESALEAAVLNRAFAQSLTPDEQARVESVIPLLRRLGDGVADA